MIDDALLAIAAHQATGSLTFVLPGKTITYRSDGSTISPEHIHRLRNCARTSKSTHGNRVKQA